MYIEIFIVIAIIIFLIVYRKNTGDSSYKFISKSMTNTYNKYAPYSFKVMREKIKDLGLEFTTKDYLIQIVVIGGLGAGIG